ncbi:hypothetical protein PTQ55_16720 [Klebsiella pasteurii]|uniref:tail fiber/spike domain-containing protein n=1 Tax=Klebsiella pasteurii TaxID=2587529 RepID=UPI00287F08B9|nr:hypothetical protein [Klebsiella pasteurii]MDS7913071.1 hypothetical protein [Klebsiella pasteurii]
MPATPQDRLYGLTTSVAVKPPVYISADYEITRFGEQTITSKTPTDERTITTTEGMRVLLLGQDNPVENGIWVARRSFWVRATDFNGPRDAVNGTLVFSINGDCWQVEADDPVVIGKSAIHFRPTYPFEANLDIFQRTLRVPEASVNVLPSAEERAWKGLGFDGAGQPKLQDPAGTGLWGYVPAIGSFEKGSLLTQRFEVLLWESTDEYWRWDGAMPKIVLPGSTPDTAGGRGKGKWLDVTDATLRSNLGSDEEGMGTWLSTHVQDGVVTQNLHDFLNAAINEITPEMFGGNLQTAFTFASANKLALNLAAKTYVITEPVTFTGGITVFGKGQHKTKIQQTAGTCGIIQTLSATDDPVVYEGFTLETTQDFNEDNRALVVDGSGLVASAGAQIGDRTRRRGMFRDLRIAGSASSRISGIGWGVALDLISLGWYETDGLNIQGCSTKDNNYKFQGIGILHRGGGWTVETYHSDAWMYFLEYCWYCPDYTEGVFIDKWNIVNVTNAIVGGVTDEKWSADPAGKLGVYQASLSNIHINATTVGIYLVNTNYSDVQNIFVLLDDHAVSTANYAVHLRNGKACNASKVNVLHYSTNTGVTRQGIILNAMSDCFISNFQCQSYSADYEKVTSAFNTVNSSNRNVIDGIKVSFADVAVTNGAGCGNTSIKNYRFSSVTSPVLDNNGDMDRGNIDSRYEAFTLSAAADSYTLTIVPRCYMSRRPTGVSAEITSPTTLAFPIQAFPDYANSTATAVSIIVKPTLSGNKLPATTFGVTIIMKD